MADTSKVAVKPVTHENEANSPWRPRNHNRASGRYSRSTVIHMK
jgi:hypothetical protein